MTRKERIRFVRLAGMADFKGCMVPIMESRGLNLAVIAESDRIRADRTARRYRRSDNANAVRDSLAA